MALDELALVPLLEAALADVVGEFHGGRRAREVTRSVRSGRARECDPAPSTRIRRRVPRSPARDRTAARAGAARGRSRSLEHAAASAGDDEDVVDSQPEVALERVQTVVPPGVRASPAGRTARKLSVEPRSSSRAERRALRLAEEHLARPELAGRGRRGPRARRCSRRARRAWGGRASSPAQPVGERGAATAACTRTSRVPTAWPFGHVRGDHAHVADGRREHALLRVLEAGDSGRTSRRAAAREDRDAVIGLLPEHARLVARRLELGVRELVVLELELLQADDVGRDRASQSRRCGSRTFSELTFHVAIFIARVYVSPGASPGRATTSARPAPSASPARPARARPSAPSAFAAGAAAAFCACAESGGALRG